MTFITKKHIHRRTFLRGAGVAIALPLLDSMLPAFAQSSAKRPLRFGAIYMPNGVYPQLWHPTKVGTGFEFQPIMRPLEPYRDHLVTIGGLKAPDGSVHLGASAAFLNGVGPVNTAGSYGKIESKKTVDQYIADVVAEDTPLRSLELGTEDMGTAAGACDGFPCVFFNTLSWRDDTSPLPVGINPQVTFERMFGDPGTPQQRLARLQAKQSMLDSVMHETSRLQKVIGAKDNAILDEYLTNIRRVEEQLQKMQARSSALTNAADGPVGIPEDFNDHMTVTYDLLHIAFQGDISRVFSLMLGHEGSGRSYAHVGVKDPHHSTSHHKNTPESIEQYARITAYQMVKLGEFLEKLKNTPDGDGSLLDSSLVYFGAGMSNGLLHDRHNVPAALIGGANGRLAGNRHIEAPVDQPTSDLLLGMADLLGAEVETIGIATGRFNLA
jgi:hypothetical protein